MTETRETKDQGTGMTQGHALDLKLPIGGLIGGYGALSALTIGGPDSDARAPGPLVPEAEVRRPLVIEQVDVHAALTRHEILRGLPAAGRIEAHQRAGQRAQLLQPRRLGRHARRPPHHLRHRPGLTCRIRHPRPRDHARPAALRPHFRHAPRPHDARDRSRGRDLPPLRTAWHCRHRGLRRLHPVLPRHTRHAGRLARTHPHHRAAALG